MADPTAIPMVTKAEPMASDPPRPGFWEAVVWCIVFWVVMLAFAVTVILGVLTAYALQDESPGRFLESQMSGFVNAAKPAADGQPRPSVPAEIGQALAYGMFAAQVGALLLIAVVVPWRVGRDWKRQLGVRRPAAMHVFLVVLVVPAFIVLAEGMQELFVRVTGLTPSQTESAIRGTFQQVPWFITFLAVAAGPGLIEEVWCRGFLGRGLCARYGLLWGVVLTSVLFSAMHGDHVQFLIFLLMGAYLHFVYLASRSLWVPILLHLLNNGLATFIMLNPELFQGWERFKLDLKGLRAVMDVAALGVLIFASVAFWTSRATILQVATKQREGEPAWEPTYPGISVPPPEAPAKVSYGAVSPVAVILALVSFVVLVALAARYRV